MKYHDSSTLHSYISYEAHWNNRKQRLSVILCWLWDRLSHIFSSFAEPFSIVLLFAEALRCASPPEIWYPASFCFRPHSRVTAQPDGVNIAKCDRSKRRQAARDRYVSPQGEKFVFSDTTGAELKFSCCSSFRSSFFTRGFQCSKRWSRQYIQNICILTQVSTTESASQSILTAPWW